MLRIALAQVNATVGDLDGNAELIVDWTRRAAERGRQLVVFPEMMLTGYPVEDLALRASFVEASSAALRDAGGPARRPRGSASSRSSSATSTARADPAPRTGPPAGAPQNARGAAARRARGRHATPSTTCRTTASSTSSATSCPATRCLTGASGCAGVDVALADLRGPVAGRRPGGGRPRGRRRAARGASTARRTSATRTTSGCDAGARAGPREAGCRAGLRQHGRRPGRAGLRRRLDRRRRRRRAAGPGAAVRARSCSSSTSTCPPRPSAAADRRSTRATAPMIAIERVTLPVGRPPPVAPDERRRPAPVVRRGSTDEAEVYARAGPRAARLRAQERLPLGGARPVRRDRLGAGRGDRRRRDRRRTGCTASRCRAGTPPSTRVTDAEDLAERTGPALPRRSRSRRWSTRSWRTLHGLTGLAEENLQARVRGMMLMALSNAGGPPGAGHRQQERAGGRATRRSTATRSGGFAPIKDVPKTLVWELARWRNEEAARRGRDAADPGELDHQAADAPSCARAARHRLAARLRGARRDARRLRRAGPGHGRAGRGRVRPGRWSSGCSGWSTRPSTSGGSTRRARRSRLKAFGRDRRLPITNRWREPRPSAIPS